MGKQTFFALSRLHILLDYWLVVYSTWNVHFYRTISGRVKLFQFKTDSNTGMHTDFVAWWFFFLFFSLNRNALKSLSTNFGFGAHLKVRIENFSAIISFQYMYTLINFNLKCFNSIHEAACVYIFLM